MITGGEIRGVYGRMVTARVALAQHRRRRRREPLGRRGGGGAFSIRGGTVGDVVGGASPGVGGAGAGIGGGSTGTYGNSTSSLLPQRGGDGATVVLAGGTLEPPTGGAANSTGEAGTAIDPAATAPATSGRFLPARQAGISDRDRGHHHHLGRDRLAVHGERGRDRRRSERPGC